MAFAVIKTGGKQYIVEAGRYYTFEKIMGSIKGDSVTFDEVLLVDDGKSTEVGTPTVGGKVTGTVLEEGKGVKKVVIKYKAKSRYFKKRGHRQPFFKVKIDSLS